MLSTLTLLIGFSLTWIWIFSQVLKKKPFLLPQNPLRRARWRGDSCLVITWLFVFLPAILINVSLFLFPAQNSLPNQPLSVATSPLNVQDEKRLNESEDTVKSGESTELEKSAQQWKDTQFEIFEEETQFEIFEEETQSEDLGEDSKTQNQHSIFEFLTQNPSILKFFLIFLYAAILAPILEEFVFRLIIQGWLDAREREIFVRDRLNGWRSLLVTAILFSLLHYRDAKAESPSESIMGIQFSVLALVSILVLFFGIFHLRVHLHLRWREIGLDFSHWKSDLWHGFLAFWAAALPTYLLQNIFGTILKNRCAPDFIALIPIALAFGYLFWRTRRLLPGIVTHCLFNGFSIIQVFILYLTTTR